MKVYKIVKVEWDDSCAYRGWRDAKDREDNKPVGCMSCGILVKTKKGSIGVAHSVAPDEDIGDTIVIPRSVIKKMEVLSKFRL